jgi:Ca2+-binding EF-hand superfamily protein
MKPVLICAVFGGIFGTSLAYTQTQAEMNSQTQSNSPSASSSPSTRQPKYMAKMDEQFQSADTDKDGALTREEAKAGNLKRILDHFDRLDANKDGKVTREEIRALIRSRVSS